MSGEYHQGHKKLLMFVHLPPPIHGVSVMSEAVVQSRLIQEKFKLDVIPIRFSADINQLNRFSLKKLLLTFQLCGRLIERTLVFRPQAVYFTLVPTGQAFYRDAFFVFFFKLLRCKMIYHLHGKGIREYAQHPFRRFLYRFVFKRAKVVHLSKMLYDDIREFVPPADCYFVANGIADVTAGDRILDRRPRHREPPQILFFSNMFEAKGPLVLLRALDILKRRRVEFQAVYAGGIYSQSVFDRFNELVQEFNLQEEVCFIGPVYGDKKEQLFLNTDIFAFPTLSEAFGLVILEAMQYGVPTVASIEGSTPEIVEDGRTGYLVPKGDAEKLANQIEVLLKDPEKRRLFGLRARQRFKENFSFEKFEQNMAETFEAIIH